MASLLKPIVPVGSNASQKGASDGSAGKESSGNAGDTGDAVWVPGSGRFPARGNGNPLQ